MVEGGSIQDLLLPDPRFPAALGPLDKSALHGSKSTTTKDTKDTKHRSRRATELAEIHTATHAMLTTVWRSMMTKLRFALARREVNCQDASITQRSHRSFASRKSSILQPVAIAMERRYAGSLPESRSCSAAVRRQPVRTSTIPNVTGSRWPRTLCSSAGS